MMNIDALEKSIGYSFKDKSLLMQALTHPSYLGEHKAQSNQRMEYLGDAVLELSVSTYLYDNCSRPEGELTRIRAAIVSEKPLSEVAKSISLGSFLVMSHGELAGGGAQKPSILSDAMEAVFGAVYLDGGFERAREVILRLMMDRIVSITANYKQAVDYKSRLQELLQKNGNVNLEYVLLSSSGPAHQMHYEFAVCLDGKELGRGSGGTKKEAQQNAAGMALNMLAK